MLKKNCRIGELVKKKRKMSESIFTYEAPFEIFALNWSNRSDERFRLAISECVTERRVRERRRREQVEILRFDPYQRILPYSFLTFDHPITSANTLAFMPDPACHHPDLLASAADTLRLWQITDGCFVDLRCNLTTNIADDDPDLRTLDWNAEVTRRIAALGTDSICTVWDIEREAVELQLFTHRSRPAQAIAVEDVAWGGPDVLAATFNNGRVKVVDVRMGGANAIYTMADRYAHKVEWNDIYPNYLAVAARAGRVVVLDQRRPGLAVAQMRRHQSLVTTMAWDPYSSSRLCTAGADARALVWEIPAPGRSEVVAEYAAGGAVEQLKWSCLQPEWAAFVFDNKLQIVQVVNVHG